jgi:hypothetical protein
MIKKKLVISQARHPNRIESSFTAACRQVLKREEAEEARRSRRTEQDMTDGGGLPSSTVVWPVWEAAAETGEEAIMDGSGGRTALDHSLHCRCVLPSLYRRRRRRGW